MKWKLVVAILAVGAVNATALAQGHGGGAQGSRRGSGPRTFDPATVTTISGEVLAVNEVQQGRRGTGMHAEVKSGTDVVDVHLGPSWYLDRQKTKIAKGDTVEVTGSKVTLQGKPALLAQTVKKGAEVLSLRDATGVPAWAGPRRR